jgi:hypothetical protein
MTGDNDDEDDGKWDTMDDNKAAHLLRKLNNGVHTEFKDDIESIIQLIALNHARNLYKKGEYAVIKKSKEAFQ